MGEQPVRESQESLTGEQCIRKIRKGRPIPFHTSNLQDYTDKDFHLCWKDPPFEAYTPNQLSDGEKLLFSSEWYCFLIPQLPKKNPKAALQDASLG